MCPACWAQAWALEMKQETNHMTCLMSQALQLNGEKQDFAVRGTSAEKSQHIPIIPAV